MWKLSTSLFTFLLSLSVFAVTDYQIEIIKDYTARGYMNNSAISAMIDSDLGPIFLNHSADNEFSRYIYQYQAQLNGALNALPSYGEPGKTVVYRGIYAYDSEERKKLLGEVFYKGRVWKERRYSSSTTSLKVAQDFASGAYKNEGCGGCASSGVEDADPRNSILLKIVSRSGKLISQLSYKKEEDEVLFKSGTVFKVTNVIKNEDGSNIIEMEELDPKALSVEDSKKLQVSEEKRLKELLGGYSSEELNKLVSEWKKVHQEWIDDRVLEQEIDFEYWQ